MLPHSPLRALAEDLWIVTGALPHMALPRTMTVWRHPSGDLWLHSVIQLDEPTLTSLLALGRPRWMVVPSGLHRLDAPWYHQRFPDLTVLAPADALSAVAERVPVDATCEEALPPLGIRCLPPAGLRPAEVAYRLPLARGGAALVVNDALFNLQDPIPGFGGHMLRLLGSTGPLRLTRLGRWTLLRDATAFATWLRELAMDADLRLIIVSHGAPVTSGAAEALRAAAERVAP